MKLKKNAVRFGAALAATAVVCLGAGALPAYADPTTPPGSTTLVGTGSDTIQDVVNGLSSAIGGGSIIASFDATNPASGIAEGTILTHGSTAIDRPDGSGDGVKLLSYSADGLVNTWDKTKVVSSVELYPAPATNVEGFVDFARSSSGPQSTSDLTRPLSYISFAQDAVTYAFNSASDFPRTLPQGSAADAASKLTVFNIYNCNGPAAGKYSYTDRDFNSVTINPLVPQSGSGTRKYWSEKVAADHNTAGNFGSCVTDRSGAVQEHNGNSLTGAGDIVPFSIAQYIAQGNYDAIKSSLNVTVKERRGLAQLGNIGADKPLVFNGGVPAMNPNFVFKRFVYIVVPTSTLNAANDPSGAAGTRAGLIRSTFVGNGSSVCQQATVIQQFGFATIGSQCGVVQGTSNYTP